MDEKKLKEVHDYYILYLVSHPEFSRYTGEDIVNIAWEMARAYKNGLEGNQ